MKRPALLLLVSALSAFLSASLAAASGQFDPFTDGTPVSAKQMNANIALIEEAAADIIDRVVEVRKAQIQFRSRLAELADLLSPAARASSLPAQKLEPLDTETWTAVAGRRIEAGQLNSFFQETLGRLASIDEFNQFVLKTAVEDLAQLNGISASYSLPALSDQVDVLPEVPDLVPVVFTRGSTLSAAEVNGNFEGFLRFMDVLRAQADALEPMIEEQHARVTELREFVGVPLLHRHDEDVPQCTDLAADHPYRVHDWSISPASPADLPLGDLSLSISTGYETTVLEALASLPADWGLELGAHLGSPPGLNDVRFVSVVSYSTPLSTPKGVYTQQFGIRADKGSIVEMNQLFFTWYAVRFDEADASSYTYGPTLFRCHVPVQYTFR